MPSPKHHHRHSRFSAALALLPFFACTLAAIAASRAAAQQDKGAGATVSAETSAKDVGLPLYPGSRRHKGTDENSPGANFGLWGGGSGFKLAVLKMESGDAPDKVANYYKKALAKYGTVLDCSHPSAKDAEAEKNASESQLTCGDDTPEKGGTLYKAGSKNNQHLVAIQPSATGTLYQLVYLAHWDADKKK
jgi:hypothetical protein